MKSIKEKNIMFMEKLYMKDIIKIMKDIMEMVIIIVVNLNILMEK